MQVKSGQLVLVQQLDSNNKVIKEIKRSKAQAEFICKTLPNYRMVTLPKEKKQEQKQPINQQKLEMSNNIIDMGKIEAESMIKKTNDIELLDEFLEHPLKSIQEKATTKIKELENG